MDGTLTRVVRAAAPWLLGVAVLLSSLAVVDGFMTVRSVTDERLLFAMWPAAAVASYYAALRLHRRSALPGYVAGAAREQLTALTDREHEVVRAVAEGLSNAEIDRVLTMRQTAVKAHVSRALAKLGLTNRVQAALLVRDAEVR